MGGDALRRAELLDLLAQAVHLLKPHQRLVAQVGQRHRPVLPERRRLGKNDEQVLPPELLGAEKLVVDGKAGDGAVELVVEQGFDEGVGEVLAEDQLARGELLAEEPQGRGHQIGSHGRDGPDGEHAPPFVHIPLEVGLDVVDLGQDPTGPWKEGPTGVGQHHSPGLAVEELRAEGRLQAPKLLTERRLGDVAPHRGPGDAAGLGGRDEIAELVDLHMPCQCALPRQGSP